MKNAGKSVIGAGSVGLLSGNASAEKKESAKKRSGKYLPDQK